jgi:hypothetical protein
MAAEFAEIFGRLRLILQKHGAALSVKEDSADCYSLDAPIGPATLRAWGGKAKINRIPVAWTKIGKGSVTFHLMALDGDSLGKTMSKELQGRMQGKTCFNFKKTDEKLFGELEDITARGIAEFKQSGFIA